MNLKEVSLNEKGHQRLLHTIKSDCVFADLSERDIEDSISSFPPGTWIILNWKNQRFYLAFVNVFADEYSKIKVMIELNEEIKRNIQKSLSEIEVLIHLIRVAISRRRKLLNSENLRGVRWIYGKFDCLPGLIVDMHEEFIIVQINTAGIDRFREGLKNLFQEEFPQKMIRYLDNEAYRKSEGLPTFLQESSAGLSQENEFFKILDNQFQIAVSNKSFQKIGYYYDHSTNRKKLESFILSLPIEEKNTFNEGLDLFSYVGTWGLHLLRSGVKNVDFVDQGDMKDSIEKNLSLNNFLGRGSFIRSDVFQYLDEAKKMGKSYHVIVSDPPAFAKNEKGKKTALVGYEKLHTKCLQVLSSGGIFAVGSCTHYVSFEELDLTVQAASQKCQRRLQLLDIGIQRIDHGVYSLKDKGFYIKYLLYKSVE